eukprot:1739860-Prymnesium_polylepis.1
MYCEEGRRRTHLGSPARCGARGAQRPSGRVIGGGCSTGGGRRRGHGEAPYVPFGRASDGGCKGGGTRYGAAAEAPDDGCSSGKGTALPLGEGPPGSLPSSSMPAGSMPAAL